MNKREETGVVHRRHYSTRKNLQKWDVANETNETNESKERSISSGEKCILNANQTMSTSIRHEIREKLLRPFQGNIILWIIVGTILILNVYASHLKFKLVNGDCCEMTYSRYQFIPIQLYGKKHDMDSDMSNSLTHRYRLLKFVDSRDRRMWSITHKLSKKDKKNKNINERETSLLSFDQFSNWCSNKDENNPGHVVIFIPGHWGTYEQARSLGAHGIRLTGKQLSLSTQNSIIKSIQRRQSNANATGDLFLYDVYAIDFASGEGSTFHGSTLFAQANFVRLAINSLKEACDVTSVTLVGHSIGGFIARAAPILHHIFTPKPKPNKKSYQIQSNNYEISIDSIITLATPHQSLPYIFDQSVHHFFQSVNNWWIRNKSAHNNNNCTEECILSQIPVVSISGGFRDELIPPNLCNVESFHQLSISALASDITTLKSPKDKFSYGMDHRAIVWCHQVLAAIRSVVDVTSKKNDSLYNLREMRKILFQTENEMDAVKFQSKLVNNSKLLKDFRSSLAFLLMPYNYTNIFSAFVAFAVYFQILGLSLTSDYASIARTTNESFAISLWVVYKKELIILSTILFFASGFHLIHDEPYAFSLLCTMTASVIYFILLHIILPCCVWIGKLRWIQKVFHSHMSTKFREILIPIFTQIGFVSIFVFGIFAHFSTSSTVTKLCLATQGFSFLLVIHMSIIVILRFAFFPGMPLRRGFKEFDNRKKPVINTKSDAISHQYFQQQLVIIALASFVLSFGKIVYSYNLLTFRDLSYGDDPLAYNDYGIELIQFSAHFLLPLNYQFFQFSEYKDTTSFAWLSQLGICVKLTLGSVWVIVLLQNNSIDGGLFQWLVIMLSTSAMFQTMC